MHLTVAIVDFLTPYKRRRTGICSSFFASIDPEKEPKQVVMWIKRGLFELPALDQDMVLIGPGTGLAGMRAILQERKFLRTQRRITDDGEQTAGSATHLYFGCRHEKKVSLMTALRHPHDQSLDSHVLTFRNTQLHRTSCTETSSSNSWRRATSPSCTRLSLATRCVCLLMFSMDVSVRWDNDEG